MIEINLEREAFLKANKKVVLKACPGSGKTTSIALKLKRLVDSEYKYSNANGIACLSFTNTAKDEIKQKYLTFSNTTLNYPHIVSTIDSFINTYITLPFYYLLKNGDLKRPTILEENTDLNNFYIKTLYQYDKSKRKTLPIHKNNEGKYLIHIYPPSDIFKDENGEYTYKGNIPKADKVNIDVFKSYAEAIKKWQFEKNILTNYDSTRFAYIILSRFKHVAKALAIRFNRIIVDEAQDTSEVQHLIFKQLEENGLQNLEFVGDPYQSLYVWRDAKPKVFLEKYVDPSWNALNLSDNWRSTATIINTFSLLRNSTDEAINAKNKFDKEEPIYILTFEEGKEFQALEKYEVLCKSYIENRVVTRGVDLSLKLNGLSEEVNYWKNECGIKIVNSVFFYKTGDIKSAIDIFRSILVEGIIYTGLTYKEKKEKTKELKEDYNLNSQIASLLNDFSNFNITLLEWTAFASKSLTDHFKITTPFDFELKKGIHSPSHKKLMTDLFPDKRSKWSFTISTIHKVKGMSLDSLLLFLNKNKTSISISDISPAISEMTEHQTLIYVAMSRPKFLLAIAIDEKVDKKDIIQAIGEKIEFR